jgi:hypothetical protein
LHDTASNSFSDRRNSRARKSHESNVPATNKDLDIEVKITAEIQAPVEVDLQTEIKNFQILSPSNTHITGAPNTSVQKPSETYGGGTLGDFKNPTTTNGIFNIANQEIGVYL